MRVFVSVNSLSTPTANMRDNTVRTFVSLCLLNLFLFLQLVAATEQIDRDLYFGKDPKFRCAVAHHALHMDIEVATTEVPLSPPRLVITEAYTAAIIFSSCDVIFSPGRGPPAFHA